MLLGIVLSRSRAGVGLAALVSIAMLLLAFVRRREHPQTFRWFLGFVIFGGLLAFQFGFLAIADRLTQAGDQRWDVTAGVLAVSSNFSWLGTGIGSFPSVYAAHEPVELVGAKILNHAHNDWAELWVELGVTLIVVATLFAWWLLARLRELISSGSLAQSSQALRLTGIGVLLTLCVHSLVDYPLRTTAVSVVFALGGALACCRLESASPRPRRDSRSAMAGAERNPRLTARTAGATSARRMERIVGQRADRAIAAAPLVTTGFGPGASGGCGSGSAAGGHVGIVAGNRSAQRTAQPRTLLDRVLPALSARGCRELC
ncbi:MAG: O-antigen ligase family protein [Rhodanobacteraceae bacterium]|nr:O-antigen ligase family protein [Rhodanobacteraceae bacterium]